LNDKIISYKYGERTIALTWHWSYGAARKMLVKEVVTIQLVLKCEVGAWKEVVNRLHETDLIIGHVACTWFPLVPISGRY